MYRVLLADDERIVLEGMGAFPWEANGCEVVGSASDGEEAWDLVQRLHPDIVISDIRMPGMDGLKLSHLITEFDPTIAILIITGFTEFSYAKEALQIGVVDLLVKPVGVDSLREGVSKAIAWLCGKRKAQKDSETVKKTLPYVKEQVLLDSLQGSLRDDGELMFLAQVDGQSSVVVSLACDEQDGLKATILKDLIHRFCTTHGALSLYEYQRYCLLFLFPSLDNLQERQYEVKRWFEALQMEAWSEYHLSFSVGISSCVPSLLQLDLLRKQSLKCLYQGQQTGKNMIVCHSEGDQGSLPLELFMQVKMDLFGALQARDNQGLLASLEKLGAYMKNREEAISLYHALWIETSWSLSFPLKDVADPDSFDNPERYLEKFKKYLCDLLSRLQMKDLEAQKEIEVVVRNYINAHYSQDISLTTLSNELCYNIAYLSRLISKTCKQSFMKMLINKRMEKAKELLTSTSQPIAEVARMVGYNDVGYFTTTFRKHEGCTPLEYREQSL